MIKGMRKLLVAAIVAGSAAVIVAPAMAQGIVVQIAPPALRVETPPPLPGPARLWVWRRGHWQWNGARYIWVRGHYVRRLRPGAEWVEGHWAPRAGGYVWIRGHWR